jgi:hypothetical protein
MKYVLILPVVLLLNGCAIGAAVSAYSVNSRHADMLTSSGEKELIERVKKELKEARRRKYDKYFVFGNYSCMGIFLVR